MNWMVVLLSIVIAVIGLFAIRYALMYEGFRNVYSNSRHALGQGESILSNGLVSDVQGDPFLHDMYKRIYFLEGVARENIALNRDGPGSGGDVPRERIALESIRREIGSLRKDIRTQIANNQNPPTKPPLYSSNPMIGLPSVPGSLHANLDMALYRNQRATLQKDYTG